jgi:hypothetical protein
MSSSMLEQAVIDAQALKEAAIKNAEQEVLEKYSGEIKEAVNALLEQDMDPLADPMADPETMGTDNLLDTSSTGGSGEQDSIVGDIPFKATEQETGGAPDDTIILDLDALMEAVSAATDSNETEEAVYEVSVADFENLLQEDTDGEEMVEETKGGVKGQPSLAKTTEEDEDNPIDYEKKGKVGGKVFEEEIEIDEAAFQKAIAEILEVDLEVVPRGMMGTTHPTTIEQTDAINIAAAAEEDTVKKEENEAFNNAVKKIANLEEQVKSLKSDKNRLAKVHNELKSVARQVSDKLTELNTANGKLVYQNRILESSSLNERQKEKLVEAVSNAKSNKEAKVIYETLQESLASKAHSAPQNLSEAVSKNNRLILQSNNDKEQVSKSASERMKRLAGII